MTKEQENSEFYSILAKFYHDVLKEEMLFKSKESKHITMAQLYFAREDLDSKEFVIKKSIRTNGFSFKKIVLYFQVKRAQLLLNRTLKYFELTLYKLNDDLSFYDIN